MKVVIVGGVAGGASAAARLRRLDETCEIVIFERSGYISYANCGLPYYIGDVITEEKNLTLQTPESFYNRFKINVKVKHEVLEIDTINKCVKVINLSTDNIFYEQYDKLILSCGAKPKLPLFYEENARIFTLRTVEDTYKIKSYINQYKPKSVTIIGGGFIGVEMAENLAGLGMKISIIQSNEQLLKILDKDMVSFVHSKMTENNVDLYLGKKVDRIVNNNSPSIVRVLIFSSSKNTATLFSFNLRT